MQCQPRERERGKALSLILLRHGKSTQHSAWREVGCVHFVESPQAYLCGLYRCLHPCIPAALICNSSEQIVVLYKSVDRALCEFEQLMSTFIHQVVYSVTDLTVRPTDRIISLYHVCYHPAPVPPPLNRPPFPATAASHPAPGSRNMLHSLDNIISIPGQ
jgi:hypothetical protein